MSSIYKSSGQSDGIFGPSAAEVETYQREVEDLLVQRNKDERDRRQQGGALLRNLLDISPTLDEAASAIVDDSFTRCFKSSKAEPWNWNWYLFLLWSMGLVLRYCILFPIRLVIFLGGWLLFIVMFIIVHLTLRPGELRQNLENGMVQFLGGVFVTSWTGVIKYHGPKPAKRPNQVYVSNHTSMIDYMVLGQIHTFAVTMQKHPGWVGVAQTTFMESIGCIWFNRTDLGDRARVAQKLQEHVKDPNSNPLLIFPEGTCVNNEYCVMFKKGAFELGCEVIPVAIKYNKIFADAFWNSRKQSFTMHLASLMTSWALVCDVYFMEPQRMQPGENSIQFCERIRTMIAQKANLKKVSWDGYLKYFRPSVKLTQKKQAKYAEDIIKKLESRLQPPAMTLEKDSS